MMKTVYVSKKSGEVYDLTRIDENNAVLTLNGEEKVVALSTLKRWYVSGNVEAEAEFGLEEIVATESTTATTETETTEKPVSKVEAVTAMVEHVLNNAGATYSIEDKTLSVNGKPVLKILKTGVAIKERDAKALGINFEKKGYNHAFKARVDIADTGVMELLLKGLLEKTFDVSMYEAPLKGYTVTDNEAEVIGECKLQLIDGKVIEQYLYNIVGYTATNGKPFASHKGNITLL